MDGTLYLYHPTRKLLLFVYAHPSPTPATNVLIFIGGMFDNLLNTPYVSSLASLLSHAPTWRLIHVQLSSSGRQFGTSSLDKDVSEMVAAINFIRSTPALGTSSTKVVLMGHSTGCQDVLHYITSGDVSSRPPIHGAILQAPVSDRDSLLHSIATSSTSKTQYDTCMDIISETPASEHRSTLLPFTATSALFGPAPMSIERFLSLASPNSPSNPSADDKFSSDATPETLALTFGRIGSPSSPLQPPFPSVDNQRSLLILISGSDEYMAASVDKDALLIRWGTALDDSQTAYLDPDSEIIPNGLHDFSGEAIPQRYARIAGMRLRVLYYLEKFGDVGEECWNAWRADEGALAREFEEWRKKHDGGLKEVKEGIGGMKL